MSERPLEVRKPSLEEFELYCRICDSVKAGLSLGQSASTLGVERSAITRLINKFERQEGGYGYAIRFGDSLISRAEKRSTSTVSAAGWSVYKKAKQILETHDELFKQIVPELRVGVASEIDYRFLPDAIAEASSRFTNVPNINVRESDLSGIIHGLREGELNVGIGPQVPGVELSRILTRPIDAKLEFVAVCSPGHRFATKALTQIRLSDLAQDRIITFRRDDSRLVNDHVLSNLVEHNDLIEVDHFSTLLTFARVGIGVGIMPGRYDILDELRKRGELYYLRLADVPRYQLATYELDHISSQSNTYAAKFLDVVHEIASKQRFKSTWQDEIRPIDFMEHFQQHPLKNYCYENYVTCTHLGYSAPEWRFRRLSLRMDRSGKTFRGKKHKNEVADGSNTSHELVGHVKQRVLHYFGTKHKPGGHESYVVVINAIGKQNSLIGTWTGEDDAGRPLSGTIVLSKRKLNRDTLNLIAEDMHHRHIHLGKSLQANR